jgi:MFS family permease
VIPRLPGPAWAVLGGDALSAAGSGMTLPFLLVYLHTSRGLPVTAAALAVAAVALASLIGNPLGGSLADRFGARNTLISGLLIAAAGAILLLAVRQPWHAFAAAATAGLGASIAWPAQDTLLATLAGAQHRSGVFALRHATLNAGLGSGALIAAAIIATRSPHAFTILYLADAATYLAFIPILLTLRTPPPHRAARTASDRPPGRAAILRDRVFVRVWLLCALVVTVSYGQLNSAFPAYATGPGGLSPGSLSLAYAANALTVAAAQLLVLRLLQGRRRTTAITLACGTWALAWTLTLAAGHLGHHASAPITFAAALAVFALAETLLSPTFAAIVNDIAPEPLRGRYNGLSTLAWTTGFLIGPAIAGTTLGAHHGTALLLGLITACAAAALGAARLARHLPPEANHIQPPAAPSPAPATPRGERPKATGRPAGREAPAAHVPGTVATP